MDIYRRILLLAAFVISGGALHAQTDLTASDLKNPSLISPYYFGPNAFPVPDILEGTTSRDLRVELGGDYFHGHQGDRTSDVYLKLNIPLFSERVNLTAWMPVMEWWNNSPERRHTCRLDETVPMKGKGSGDVYVSTDIWVLQAERNSIDLSVRAAMKTASGGGFSIGRHYDAPGYFFDATVSRPFSFSGNHIKELRISCSGGFLCWQTANGRQNDAVMYGAAIKLRTRKLTVRETLSGYMGWENSASYDKSIKTGDCPFSLKSDLIFHHHNFEFIFRYQLGLYDWPFHQFRFGVAYNIGILK